MRWWEEEKTNNIVNIEKEPFSLPPTKHVSLAKWSGALGDHQRKWGSHQQTIASKPAPIPTGQQGSAGSSPLGINAKAEPNVAQETNSKLP